MGVYSIGNASIFRPAFQTVPGLCFLPFQRSEPFLTAVRSGDVDMTFCTPTLNQCLSDSYGFSPVAGLIGLNNVTTISGDILVRPDSPIMSIADLHGTKLICGPFYITAVFQLQAAAIGADIFSLFSVIAVESNQTVVMQSLLNGSFDVAFLRSDTLTGLRSPVRIVAARQEADSPVLSSTPAYPQWQLQASPTVSAEDRLSAYNALSSIAPTDPAAVLANMTGFGLPYSYLSYLRLLQTLGLAGADGKCTVTTDQDVYPYVSCPAGTIKITAADSTARCARYPECSRRVCICSPCYRPVTAVALGLQPNAFWPLVLGSIVGAWLLSWLLQTFQSSAGLVPTVPHDQVEVLGGESLGVTRNGEIVLAKVGLPGSVKKWATVVPVLGPEPDPGWSSRAVWQRAADACRIDHPNLLAASGVLRQDGRVLLVQGQFTTTLEQSLRRQARPDLKALVRVGKEMACGLQRLHADDYPILHRPSIHTTVLHEDGRAMLLLCGFRHPPSTSRADDVGHLGRVLWDMLSSTGFHDAVLDRCQAADPRERPPIGEVLMRLTGIEQEMQMSHMRLLDSILPPFASDALSQGQDVELKHHEAVAILFCDIVGFTTICDSIPAASVGEMLGRLYLAFDTLAIRYCIHKQEVVGDCWVGATNLLRSQPHDYAARLATFALELISAAGRTEVVIGGAPVPLQVRVGIHVGPVVAGVVGTTLNPKFCIFGDTINVTQRMESTSAANRVHLSQPAAEAVSQQSPGLAACIVKRGVLDIKGKGPMTTFWLI